jgi:hypothetical protein
MLTTRSLCWASPSWWRWPGWSPSGRCAGRDHPAHFFTYRKVLPQMSDTERDALEAGTVWWEGELFRGSRTGRSCTPIRSPS